VAILDDTIDFFDLLEAEAFNSVVRVHDFSPNADWPI
jgi:hypothetical protein